jgi:cyclopropane-fatty-acyl-phospholipid synthase
MLFTAALAYAGLISAFTAAWTIQLRTHNAGMVDPLWAASLGGVAALAAALGTGSLLNRACVLAGGGIWGTRLAWHLWRRNHGHPEDARYRQLRLQWGSAAARNMFWFFQLQALVALLLSCAFLVPAFGLRPASPPALAAAIGIWAIAIAGEAAADRQLERFRANPENRGNVCRSGWWRYSRHPNYFFECLHWFAYTALSFELPWGWITLAPPLLMGWLLLKISGIPVLEAHLVRTRPAYRDYMRSTSVLIPWPPRRVS